jgi:hypothetical protein
MENKGLEYMSPLMQLLCRLSHYKLPMDVVSSLLAEENTRFNKGLS